MSKQSHRRRLARLRAELHDLPMAMEPRALGALQQALLLGDLPALRASRPGARVPQPQQMSGEQELTTTEMHGPIAMIPITGCLMEEDSWMVRWGYASSYQVIERDFNNAIGNSQVGGVLFYIDSPGGSASGCKRVADLIFAARGTKPIRAYTQGMCCSAAYYIAAACDRIEATADAYIGSIGTILTHMEISGLLKEWGYGATVLTNAASPKKGHGNMYEPLSDAARATLQACIESYGTAFLADVSRYRGVPAETVAAKFGQGDGIRAEQALPSKMLDAVVSGFPASLASITAAAAGAAKQDESGVRSQEIVPVHPQNVSPASAGHQPVRSITMKRIKAQLFALGLIESMEATDAECQAALKAWCKALGREVPKSEAKILALLQSHAPANSDEESEEDEELPEEEGEEEEPESEDDEPTEEDEEEETQSRTPRRRPAARRTLRAAHNREQSEARLANLTSAAELVNATAGRTVVSAQMVLDAVTAKLSPQAAMKKWAKTISADDGPAPSPRISSLGEGATRFASDAIDALASRAGIQGIKLSAGAAQQLRKPLWAIAGECMQLAGHQVDMFGSRELIAEKAMQMGTPGYRHEFYSQNELPHFVPQASSGTPAARPGDFPNILSGLANKYLDMIELADDYSYEAVSAMLPGGLNDFKPAPLINRGAVEELDEIQDAEQVKEIGLQEEVLSYIFLRRFANKFGWTPVLIANDDLGAFAEGMIGLEEAWRVTQNRMVVDLFTSNPTLLDGNSLFANRTDTGAGPVPAANLNDRSAGNPPSDVEWEAMESLYADIGGIATGRRVRGTLTTAFVPTGAAKHAAVRTFEPFAVVGEDKIAAESKELSIFRGKVKVIPESELRTASTQVWYGLRNPTMLNTATVIRAYFNGFGTAGRRERWYDPERKTTWISLEGRIATAIKNWRYVIRNAGTGAS